MNKPFQIVPSIQEYETVKDFVQEKQLTSKDLILTNAYIYKPQMESLGLPCAVVFQEEYGNGEPTDAMVNAILKALESKPFDRIVAIGGGTIIDIAKVIAVSVEGKDVDYLYDHVSELKKTHPLTIVPTTCGTGSEVTNISIINRLSKGVKMGLVSTEMFANEAILIPSLLQTLPYNVYATSSIDALVHSVESYLSPNACALSELFSVHAMTQIITSWTQSLESENSEAWKEHALTFLRASNQAGIAFGYAGCAAVHATAYPLGGVYHIPHGQSNQMMFEAVMHKYLQKKPIGKINQLQNLLADIFHTAPETSLQELCDLMDRVLKKNALHEKGIQEEDLPVFAKNVIETQQRLLNNNYVPLSEAEILEIYKEAY